MALQFYTGQARFNSLAKTDFGHLCMYTVFYKVQRTKYFRLDVIKIYIVHSLGSGLPAKIIFLQDSDSSSKDEEHLTRVTMGTSIPLPNATKEWNFY
jgi:hypothetical protein